MSFNNYDANFDSAHKTGYAGEPLGLNIINSNMRFVDGVTEGDIALLKNGVVDPTGTVFAGVIKRDLTGAAENNGTLTNEFNVTCDVVEAGVVNVNVKAGVTPVKYGTVFVDVAGSRVTATTSGTGKDVDAYFYEEVAPGVWSIVINKPGKTLA